MRHRHSANGVQSTVVVCRCGGYTDDRTSRRKAGSRRYSWCWIMLSEARTPFEWMLMLAHGSPVSVASSPNGAMWPGKCSLRNKTRLIINARRLIRFSQHNAMWPMKKWSLGGGVQ